MRQDIAGFFEIAFIALCTVATLAIVALPFIARLF